MTISDISQNNHVMEPLHSTRRFVRNERPPGGWALTEAIVTIAIVGLLLGVGYMFFRSQRMVQDYYLLRQQGMAACMAQLDCLSAGMRPLEEETLKTYWPRLEVTLERTPGEGTWQGLMSAKARARGYGYNGREVVIQLERYVPVREERP